MRVALYGGSFDPPHVAHVLAVSYALCMGQFDKVLVVPVFEHVFDKCLADFEHRLRMCRLAWRGIPQVEVSDIESRLAKPNLTLNLVKAVGAEHPDWELQLMVGSDVLVDSCKWYAFDEVVTLAPLFVVGRVGYEHDLSPASVLPDVSSTQIRALLKARGDVAVKRQLQAWVPQQVLSYIDEHALYS